MRFLLISASASLSILLVTAPTPAAAVRCSYKGTITTCPSVPSYVGMPLTGDINYESACSGINGKHVFNPASVDHRTTVYFHQFDYVITSTTHSGSYQSGTWYEIDMIYNSSVNSFNLHCIAADTGVLMNCVVTLTYGNGASPPGNGDLPTCLPASNFRSITLSVSPKSGTGFAFTANLNITGCTSDGNPCTHGDTDGGPDVSAAEPRMPSAPRMPADPGDRVVAHPGLIRRRAGSGSQEG